ncbi:COR domain-containing protein [Pontibacter sp. G13]|uniref:COR domain-containing protein n=1 Tax=Pontibacter sp. G13 TaxID=3074898 RepID=UPI00288C632B|nr:COR domain-containing protein [Pontibacter sp. G13]WNJ19624.1 COR domain-containing protein [Pontibacter sp. G13]
MSKPAIVQQIEAIIGRALEVQPDIQGFFKNTYPPSYHEVMTLPWEMSRSYHQHTAFTRGDELIGLNLFQSEVTQAQLAELLKLELPYLQTLNLARNKIKELQIPKSWNNLQVLIAYHNKSLHTLRFRHPAPNMWRLEAAYCDLKKLELPKATPDQDSQLVYADLDGNVQLEKVAIECSYAHLIALHIRGTGLKKLAIKFPMPKVESLMLNDNKQLKFLDFSLATPEPANEPNPHLGNLHTLNLKNNQLSQVPIDLIFYDDEGKPIIGPNHDGAGIHLPNLLGLFLGNNPFSEELRLKVAAIDSDQNHLEIYRAYLKQRLAGVGENLECKVLFIGDGKAGKSSMVERLKGNTPNEEWDSTHGIILHPMDLPDPNSNSEAEKGPVYKLNLWDFGGQDVYHSTHRLFMQSNSVYMLVWSTETEESDCISHEIQDDQGRTIIREYTNRKLLYWLSYAKELGQKSPMLIAKTYRENDPPFQQGTLTELLDKFQGAFEPEATLLEVDSLDENPNQNGFPELTQALYQRVHHLKSEKGGSIALPVLAIRDHLRGLQKNKIKWIEYEAYEQEATKLGVDDPQWELQTWLTQTGVVFYRKGLMNDRIILDQAWAIDAIYTFLRRDNWMLDNLRRTGGFFTGKMASVAWSQKYPHLEIHELFIDFMTGCYLCFELEDEAQPDGFEHRMFLAPQHASDIRPEGFDDVFAQECGEYHISLTFLPDGVMQALICKAAYLRDRKSAMYRHGIRLKEISENGSVQFVSIEALTTQHTLRIQFTAASFPLLKRVRNELMGLLDELEAESFVVGDQAFDSWEDFEASTGVTELGQELRAADQTLDRDIKTPLSEAERTIHNQLDNPDSPIQIDLPAKPTDISKAEQEILELIDQKIHHLRKERVKKSDPSQKSSILEEISRLKSDKHNINQGTPPYFELEKITISLPEDELEIWEMIIGKAFNLRKDQIKSSDSGQLFSIDQELKDLKAQRQEILDEFDQL